jgi:hypothetical protein
MGLADRPTTKSVLLFPTVVLLALSTSRAGWLIAAAGLVAGAVMAGKQRVRLALAILTVITVGFAFSATPLAEPFKKGWNRTFGAGRDASSGRADQWKVFFTAFTYSPKAFLIGYGPGNGRSVFAEFSGRTPGIERSVGAQVPFHGLIMHVGAALGLLGLIPLATWSIVGISRALSAFSRTGLALPMISFLAFVLASLTVTGFDTISGIFLGLGLIASDIGFRIRQTRLRSQTSSSSSRFC